MITITANDLRNMRRRRREEIEAEDEGERKVIRDLFESADKSPAGENTEPMPNGTDGR